MSLIWRQIQLQHFLGKARRFLSREGNSFAEDLERENGVLKKAAQNLGASVIEHGLGLLEFVLGEQRTFIRANATELDSAIALKIAGDKWQTSQMLCAAGLPVPHQAVFPGDALDKARDYFKQRKRPQVIKPRNGTSGGAGITVGLTSLAGLARAFYLARLHAGQVILEDYVAGRHLRVLMLEGQLLSAVERVPASVCGDGKSTIAALIRRENRQRKETKQFPKLWPIPVDNDLHLALHRQGLSLRSIPPEGRLVPVKAMANGHQGGSVVEVSEEVHPELATLAARAAAIIGVKFAGVDLIVASPGAAPGEDRVYINEVNTTPSLYGHYQAVNQEALRDPALALLKRLLGVPQ
ncbi:MAG: hypothetical protein KDI06_04415 [Calditrichaeota bacterium]|nr:hypothetical protein [Calditrichota bacterium]HQU74333.1 hypothetical protein [Calditrichia bacterium]